MLTARQLTVKTNGYTRLYPIDLTLQPNEWLMIIGPNGAGKTTLFEALTQKIKADGEVLINGESMSTLSSKQRAQKISLLHQRNQPLSNFTVREVVEMGRYAYRPHPLANLSKIDQDMIDQALLQTGLIDQQEQSIFSLSGGEYQRVRLAQLFAQDPQILLLDEPATFLDLTYQKQFFELINKWRTQPNKAVMSIVHDLALATYYGDEVILLHQGKQHVFPDDLASVYEFDVVTWYQQRYSIGRSQYDEK